LLIIEVIVINSRGPRNRARRGEVLGALLLSGESGCSGAGKLDG
jgi:hypothetical protein